MLLEPVVNVRWNTDSLRPYLSNHGKLNPARVPELEIISVPTAPLSGCQAVDPDHANASLNIS